MCGVSEGVNVDKAFFQWAWRCNKRVWCQLVQRESVTGKEAGKMQTNGFFQLRKDRFFACKFDTFFHVGCATWSILNFLCTENPKKQNKNFGHIWSNLEENSQDIMEVQGREM